MTKEETIAATMERAYRAGVIGRAEMFKIKIMLIAHNGFRAVRRFTAITCRSTSQSMFGSSTLLN